MSVLGGPAVTICACADPPIAGLSWGRDDVIVFVTEAGSGLMRVPAAGGEAAVLTTVEEGGAAHYWPEVLPDGGGALFTEWSGGDSASRIAVVSLETGEVRFLVAGSYPQYSPTGHIVYGVDGTLRAVPFDLERLDVTGDSVLILESVTSKRTGAFNFDVSANGWLVYVLGDDGGSERRLVWFDRDGQVEPLPLPPNPYRNAQLSPDGTRLVALIENPDNNDLWVSEVDRNTLTKLTTHPGNDIRGLWTTDGERIVFLSDREIPGGSLFARAADGTSDIESVGSNEDFPGPNPLGWSPAGRRLVFQYGSAENRDIGVLSLNGEPKWDVLIATESRELNPTLSPDGRWIAYQSNQTGGAEVYVDRFPDLGQRQRVSSARGFLPQWSPDGRELFYVGGDRRRLMRVPVETGATFNFGTVEQLFQSAGFLGLQDIAPDGRFLSILPVNTPAERGQQQVVWVQNWFEELTNRVPIP